MSIGEKIRTARKNMGISQEALADKLGVSTQAVSTWERDENLPETKKLLAIAKALRLSLDYMVAEDQDDWTMKLLYADRVLDRAIEYAVIKHSGTNRKGTNMGVPFHMHLSNTISNGLFGECSSRTGASTICGTHLRQRQSAPVLMWRRCQKRLGISLSALPSTSMAM